MIVDRLGSHALTSQSFAGERARAIPNAATLSGHGRGEAGRGSASPLAARQAGWASRAGSDAFTRSEPWARRLKLLATRSTV